MSQTFVVEGILTLEEQEGGYCFPSWEMDDDRELSQLVLDHFELQPPWMRMQLPYGSSLVQVGGDIHIGRVKITIERITEATA